MKLSPHVGASRVRRCVLVIVVLAVGLSVIRTAAATAAPAASACAEVLVVSARGSGETAYSNMGTLLHSFAVQLSRDLPNATIEPIGLDKSGGYRYEAVGVWPGQAGFAPHKYAASVSNGRKALRALLETRHRQCPAEYFVLAGYSQGADLLSGALKQSLPAADRIVAVKLFGDPQFSADSPSGMGATSRYGILNIDHDPDRPPRSWADRTQSWCNRGDPFCARGSIARAHTTYDRTALTQAASFTAGKVRLVLPSSGPGQPSSPIPATEWTAQGGAVITAGAASGEFSLSFDQTRWGAATYPVAGCDYTFSGQARVTPGGAGYGFAVRAAWENGAPISGPAIQYEAPPNITGYRITEYPDSEGGNVINFPTDFAWHAIRITVRGSSYEHYVDGRLVSAGTTASPCRNAVMLRVYSSTVEVRDLRVDPLG